MRDPTRRAVFAIGVAVLAFHLIFAARYGWFRDELYYVACARRLAWGYVDHPPFVAVVARVALLLFGESLIGLRAFAALAAAGTAVLAAEIARVMGGARFAQMLAAFAAAVAPYDLAIGQIYTMNSFEPLVWSGLALLVARALGDDDSDNKKNVGKSLLLVGPIVGLGILNKHSAAWPAIGMVIGIALSPSRRLLLRREILISVAVVILLVGPHVLWQVQNGFPTREFARNALSGKNEPYGPLGFIWQQVQLMHPLSAPLWLGGLCALLVWTHLRPFRPLAVAYLFVAVLIVVTQAKAYYLGPAYGFLFAAGSVAFEHLTNKQRRMRSARIVFPILLGLGSAALLPMTVPVLSEPDFQRYFALLGGFGEAKSGEKQKHSALPQLYADMHGWPAMAARIADVVDTLPSDESYAVLTSNYGEASAIDMFARARGVKNVASGHNGWWLWGPPAGEPSAVVTIGFDATHLARFFEDVRVAGHHDDPLARADERDLTIYICRTPRMTMSEAWPTLKRFR